MGDGAAGQRNAPVAKHSAACDFKISSIPVQIPDRIQARRAMRAAAAKEKSPAGPLDLGEAPDAADRDRVGIGGGA